MKCRHCDTQLKKEFVNLGFQPPSNAYLRASDLLDKEIYIPLRLLVCEKCWLVQTADHTSASHVFNDDYAYFSSVSSSWLQHARSFCEMAKQRFGLSVESFVLEVASNDGYLLKNFLEFGIPCIGVEPTLSTANFATKIGVPTLKEFFGGEVGKRIAKEHSRADLIIANNVFAHVPDINDFTNGIREMLKPNGLVSLEFPHFLKLVQYGQFDTIYHEHFSYLTLNVLERIFSAHGLRVFDVEELATHGGSLRVFGCLKSAKFSKTSNVDKMISKELDEGLEDSLCYEGFQERCVTIKNEFLTFLLDCNKSRKSVAALGAAAKGNTLLNFAGIKPDLLPFVCDSALSKQGKFLPGSHLPIYPLQYLLDRKPDYVVVFPWNLLQELESQVKPLLDHGTRLVTAIPSLKVH